MGLTIDLTPYSYMFVLAVNIYMLLKSKNNFLFFCVFFIIFFSNYSIIYVNYIHYTENSFTYVLSPKVSIISLNILVFFNLVLLLFVKWNSIRVTTNIGLIDKRNKNNVIVYSLYILLAIIFVFGFKKPEFEGGRGEPSPAYEYSLILFILFFYYCGNNKVHTLGGLFFVFLFSMQNFVFGGRIMGLQFILCTYIILYMHKYRMSYVYVGMGIMFFLFSLMGQVRGELLSGNFSLDGLFVSLAEEGFALDTAYSAYHTSTTFVYILDNYTAGEVLKLFWEFLKSIVVGGNPDYVLTSITRESLYHQGGGVIPFYFYFYLGIVGVFLSACLVAYYINLGVRASTFKSGFKKCLLVWVVSTGFRWYLYTPLLLLRGVLFLAIAYYGLSYFHKITNQSTKRIVKMQV